MRCSGKFATLAAYLLIARTLPAQSSCIANQQPGADLGAKINACLAMGSGTDIQITAGGTISTQVVINNVSNVHIRGLGTRMSLGNGITGTNVGPAILVKGTSQNIVFEDVEVDGNSQTGAAGNGNGISIIGTGGTPSHIFFVRAGSQFNKGTGIDGSGSAVPASGIYIYQAIDIHIQGGFFGANNQGLLLDNEVNNTHVQDAGFFGNVNAAVQTKNIVTRLIFGPANDVEGNGYSASSHYMDLDSCGLCDIGGNWFESNSGEFAMTANSAAGNLDIHDNIFIHGGTSPNTNFAMDSASATSLDIHNNSFGMLQSMTSIIDINPANTASVHKIIRNNTFNFSSGSILWKAINWQDGTNLGSCIIDGNTFGDGTNPSFSGYTAIAIGSGTGLVLGCSVTNNSCATNSGTLSNCVLVSASANSTFVSNTNTSGTITKAVSDSGVNTFCFANGC